MSKLPTIPFSPDELALLREDADLLHLLFHRNKNQHRLAKWWQWLGTLRRHLRYTIGESDQITNAKSTPQLGAAVERLTARIVFMRDVVVPRAHKAFGTVLADKQFVALGCVLVGVLARVWKVIGSPGELKAVVEEDFVEQKGEVVAVDEEEGVVIDRAQYEFGQSKTALNVSAEVQGRGTVSATEIPLKARKQCSVISGSSVVNPKIKKRKPDDLDSGHSNPKAKKTREIDTKERKMKGKKKRKKEDDIDALFSGLF